MLTRSVIEQLFFRLCIYIKRLILVNGKNKMFRVIFLRLLIIAAAGLIYLEANAEYGDIVINNYASEAGIRPVIFPHWFHRIRFTCKVCHADLGFKFEAGGNKITMADILDQRFCGACHNGEIAWNIENCGLCHSGKEGLKTQIHHSTQNRFSGKTKRQRRPLK